MSKQQSCFASDRWCTLPFLCKKKTTSDRLNDILLKLPECMALSLELRESRMHGSPSEEHHSSVLESKAQWLLIRFQEYWKEHGLEVDPAYQWDPFHERSDFLNIASDWTVVSDRPVRFYNKYAARIIAEYDAGNAIVYSILRELYQDRIDSYKQNVAIHCASILEAVQFLESLGVDSGGNTSLVFPLKTIYHCTPSGEQRRRSEIELDKWGKSRGVEGVSQILDRWGKIGKV